MKSRRLMGPSLSPRITPYHIVVRVPRWCITANLEADVGDGSFTTDAVEAMRAFMSAVARKADK